MGKKKGKGGNQPEQTAEEKAAALAELLAEEETATKKKKPAPKAKKANKKQAQKKKVETSSEPSESGSDSESQDPPKKAPPAGGDSDSDSDSSDVSTVSDGSVERLERELKALSLKKEQEEAKSKKGKKAPKPAAKGKKKGKLTQEELMAMMAEDEEEDEDTKREREEEEAKKKAEEEEKKKAEEEAKKKAEEEEKKKAEEEAKKKAEEEEAANKKAEEAEEAKKAEEEEAKKKAREEEKKARKEARKAKKGKKGKKGKDESEDEEEEDEEDDDPERVREAEEGPKMTKKQRKEMERKKAFEASLQETRKEGKMGAFTDSPYDVRMAADVWKVEDNSRDIKVEGVSISVPGKPLFTNTTVKITCGHRYGLIGPNGRGKSSVLKLISEGHLPVPKNLHVLLVEQEQEVDESVLEQKVVNVVINSHKKRIEMLKEAERLRETGEDLEKLQELEDDLNAMGAHQAEAKSRKILGGLGFPSEWQDRKVSSFSGGWRKRVALACAVFMEPDVLLLDEPTNHLDLNAVIWLETYLPSVYNENKKKPKSLVVVSHDVSFLDEVCTDTVHIENHKLNYYRGNYNRFLVSLQQHHTVMDKDAKLLKDFIRDLKKKGFSGDQIDEKIEERAKKKGWDMENLPTKRQEYQVTFPWENPPELREAYIVKTEEMSFRYRDDCPWIFGGPKNKNGVDFSVWTDSRIALVGPNGCGKTTLIQLLAGVLQPVDGIIEINRQVRVGRYSQHFVDQLPLDRTAIDYLCASGVQTEFKARAKLGAYGLEGKAHLQQISTLSGGQKVRVAFAGISACLPHVLLLDEPTNHLDMESIQALADSLNEFSGGVLVITHDARLIETLEAELWVVEDNNVVKFDGGLEEYRDHLIKILDLEEERKELEEEKKRQLKKLKNESRDDDEERAELKRNKKKQLEAEALAKKQAAQQEANDAALSSFLDAKDKKSKKEKKDKTEKKEKKEKADKAEKKEKKDKADKKEKKEKKDKK